MLWLLFILDGFIRVFIAVLRTRIVPVDPDCDFWNIQIRTVIFKVTINILNPQSGSATQILFKDCRFDKSKWKKNIFDISCPDWDFSKVGSGLWFFKMSDPDVIFKHFGSGFYIENPHHCIIWWYQSVYRSDSIVAFDIIKGLTVITLPFFILEFIADMKESLFELPRLREVLICRVRILPKHNIKLDTFAIFHHQSLFQE